MRDGEREGGHCCSSISTQNAFRVCSDQVPRGWALPLFHQPTERIIPGSGVVGGGALGLRGDKILRSRVQSPDETTFYPFFCSILNYTWGVQQLMGMGL